MNPGDLLTHTHISPNTLYVYIGPDIEPGTRGRFTAYQLKMVRVIELGDPTLRQLRFHESYLRPAS